jgi:hypothetical protein
LNVTGTSRLAAEANRRDGFERYKAGFVAFGQNLVVGFDGQENGGLDLGPV